MCVLLLLYEDYRVLWTNFLVLDGSVHGQFTEDYYCGDDHKGGSFANVAKHPSDRNTEYVYLPLSDKHRYTQPYDWEMTTKSWKSCGFSKRVFLKTTKSVEGEIEFFVGYGTGYYKRHDL